MPTGEGITHRVNPGIASVHPCYDVTRDGPC